ncbi:dehydrogenase/reductase SDR family member 9-like isoform X4 [Lineus longissimus]
MIRLPTFGEVHRKYVLVTGCDGGFGRHLAHRLDSIGFRVFAGVATEEGEELVQQGASVRIRPVHLDVRDPESVKAALRYVRAHLAADGLWGVVNCAEAVGPGGYSEWLDRKDYQECWDTNVLGLTDVITTFLPMVKKVKGRIINTSSVAGRLGFTSGAPYSMAMHAVEAFSDSLRKQLKPFGVKVIIIEPGLHKMNLLGKERRNLWQTFRSAPEEIQKEYGEEFVRKLLRSDVDETLDMLISSDIEAVMDGFEHALTSLFPKKRYSVGRQAKYAFIPISYLPSSVQDFLLSLRRPQPDIVKRRLEEAKKVAETPETTNIGESEGNDAPDNVSDSMTTGDEKVSEPISKENADMTASPVRVNSTKSPTDSNVPLGAIATRNETMTTGATIATGEETMAAKVDCTKTRDVDIDGVEEKAVSGSS